MFSEVLSEIDNVGYKSTHDGVWRRILKPIMKSVYYREREKLLFRVPGVYQEGIGIEFEKGKPLAIIDGHSGCGKTHMSVTLIEQALSQGKLVTYFTDQFGDGTNGLLGAKVTALTATYPDLFKIVDIAHNNLKCISELPHIERGELFVVDDVLHLFSNMEYQSLMNLLKAREASLIIALQEYRDLYTIFKMDVSYDDVVQVAPLSEVEIIRKLALSLKKNLSFTFSWGESLINDGTPPLGQMVLRKLKRPYMQVSYIPEL